MVLISHPTSNANSRAVVKALEKESMLLGFYTSVATFPDTWLYKLGGIGPFSEIRRRCFNSSLKEFIISNPAMETGRLLASKFNFHSLTAHEKGLFSIDAVYSSQDKKVASRIRSNKGKKMIEAIYAYEDGAFNSFSEAKKNNIKCLYDLPIGYWKSSKKLLSVEEKKWPEYADTLIGLRDSEKKLSRKDKELELADCIFVASTFTANSLKEYSGHLAPIEVIPYGFPPVTKNRIYERNKRLKILFVGGLSQRKGIAYLFEAVDKLQDKIELTLVGKKTSDNCPKLDAELEKHNWIPTLAHEEVLKLMKSQDLLVFPSLFEGFGMVITEAMSQGTPVITTDRTAGPDLIINGENGWIIESGSTSSLVKKLEEIIMDPTICEKVGRNALETARKRPWEVYGKELTSAIKNHLK